MLSIASFSRELIGRTVSLHALDSDHIAPLKAMALDPALWSYTQTPDTSLEDYTSAYIDKMLVDHQGSGDPFAYTVFSNESQAVLGSSRYYEISFPDKRLCIGFTWYSASCWGQGANPEVKLLLLTQAFETLGLNRVSFHVDSRNTRSISAMLYLGATLECVMKKHKIVQGSYERDTVLFSILKSDWPIVKAKLLDRLSDG